MRRLTVTTHTWTPVPGTSFEVYQESGGTLVLTYHVEYVTLGLGGVWHVRHLAEPPRDEQHYQEGRDAARTLIDIATHTHDTMRQLLTKAEESLANSLYLPARYNRAKGMVDALREHLEDRT